MAAAFTQPATLPPEVRFEATPDGGRYRLPRRPLGWLRLLGLVPMGFGVLMLGGLASFFGGFTGGMFNASGGFNWGSLIFVAFMVPFVLGGVTPILLGLWLTAGASDIVVRDGRVAAVERLGPLRRRRRRRIDGLTVLYLGHGGGSALNGWFGSLSLLRAGTDLDPSAERAAHDKDGLFLAWGYPEAALRPLAEHVADLLGQDLGNSRPLPVIGVDLLETGTFTGRGRGDADRSHRVVERQPTESKAILDERADGLTLTLPAAGLWRGSSGLFAFSLLWCGFMVVFTTIVAAGAGLDIIFLAFITVFWAIGIGMMLLAINLGHRRVILDVVGVPGDATLLVARQDLRGIQQDDWPSRDIADVRVADSGTEVNDRALRQLRIELHTQKKPVKLLTGRPDEELAWIATTLRRGLFGEADHAAADVNRSAGA